MIDDKELAELESFMRDTGVMDISEIIRNARRYLALRENEVIIMQAADPDFDAEGYRARYDAAADRLLEGGA